MKYTVQVLYPVYYSATVTVDAETPAAACAAAIEEANGQTAWKALDDAGPTFVTALAEGDDVDLWADADVQLPIPSGYEEGGANI